jgi:diguanylate cyclase (GGDEF)-like protein
VSSLPPGSSEVPTEVARLLAVIEIHNELAGAALDSGQVMGVVVRRAAELTGADAGVVELVEGDEMVYRAVSGTAEAHVGRRLRVDASLSGLCAREGRTLRCDDVATDERADIEASLAVGAVSMVCVPLRHGDEVTGVLKVYAERPHAFDDTDVLVLDQLSGVIAAHLSHAAEFERRAFESRHDALTDLGNRRAYDERLQIEASRAARYGHPLSLVVLDLDGFKAVNDLQGHPSGDEILRRVAAVLRGTRDADECFRVGGDEFAILLPATSLEGARVVADRVADDIAAGTASVGRVTATAGVAELGPEGPDQLHAEADAELMGRKRGR